MTGSKTLLLEEACNVEYGTRVVQKRDGGSIYPVYGGGGATFKMDVFNREDRFVIARFGMSEGCTRFVTGKFFLNDSGLTVSPKNGTLDQRFLDYQLLFKNDDIFALGKGAAQKNLDAPAFREMPLCVPNRIEEQQRIVDILDEAFAGIATVKANTEKNLQKARAIFDGYLHSVFNRCENWAAKSLGEIASFRNGINFTKSSKGEAIKILGVKDFKNNYWAPLDELESVVPEGTLPDMDTLQQHDLVFVRSNGNPALIGRCLLVGEVSERTTHSGFTIRARLETSELVPTYLCHFLKSNEIRKEMTDGGNGANIKSLNQGTLSRLVVPFPSLAQQARIVEQLEEIQDETQRLETLYQHKLTALDDLKKSLLHQAFSGHL
jgi:type I restriction enzyme S subunit